MSHFVREDGKPYTMSANPTRDPSNKLLLDKAERVHIANATSIILYDRTPRSKSLFAHLAPLVHGKPLRLAYTCILALRGRYSPPRSTKTMGTQDEVRRAGSVSNHRHAFPGMRTLATPKIALFATPEV